MDTVVLEPELERLTEMIDRVVTVAGKAPEQPAAQSKKRNGLITEASEAPERDDKTASKTYQQLAKQKKAMKSTSKTLAGLAEELEF
ncbi:hypothetical protein PQX77_021446 [Marasmius sp. AFHP31]|nr:hypothetical protein PQX77_021446 [Marasmius sp. AFHP31]